MSLLDLAIHVCHWFLSVQGFGYKVLRPIHFQYEKVVQGQHVDPMRPWPLTLGTTWTNVSNSTSTHEGEHLCKFILKSIQNLRSYSQEKYLTFKCDLDLGPTWTNVSNGTSTSDGEQLHQIVLKSVPKLWQTVAHTNARTYTKLSLWQLCLAHRMLACHRDNYVSLTACWLVIVTTMSCSPHAGLSLWQLCLAHRMLVCQWQLCLAHRMLACHCDNYVSLTACWLVIVTTMSRSPHAGLSLWQLYLAHRMLACHCDNYVLLTACWLDNKTSWSSGPWNLVSFSPSHAGPSLIPLYSWTLTKYIYPEIWPHWLKSFWKCWQQALSPFPLCYYKQCEKRRKCWSPAFSSFSTMFSSFSKTNLVSQTTFH